MEEKKVDVSDLMSKLNEANDELHKMGMDIKLQEIELQKEREKNKKRLYFILMIVLVAIVIGIVCISNARAKKAQEQAELEARLQAERIEAEYQKEMQNYYADGERALSNGDYLNAILCFQKVESAAECYADAQNKITDCKEYYLNEVYEHVEVAESEERYVDAVEELLEALDIYSSEKELEDRKLIALDNLRNFYLGQAISYAEAGDYASAKISLDSILKYISNDSDILELKKEYSKRDELANLYALKNEGDYEEIINKINQSSFINDEEIIAIYEETKNLYKEQVLGLVNDNIANNGYDYAINQLENSLRYLAGDADITSKISSLSANKIKDEGFKGNITSDNQEDSYELLASSSGNYRFEIIDNNARASYKIIITDRSGNSLRNRVISSGDGVTVELESGNTYNISLKQNSEYASYTLKVYMPNEKTTIDQSTKSVNGTIYFEDQIDSYAYVPPVSGLYRFDIEDDVHGTSYKLIITDERGENLRNRVLSHGDGVNVELTAGEKYMIEMQQNSGVANYTLKIGVPKAPQSISGNSFSGNITFENQEDTFTYTAPATGKYLFILTDNSSYNSYKFKVLDERGESLRSRVISASDEVKVDLDAGSKYTIVIVQNSGFGNYSVSMSY